MQKSLSLAALLAGAFLLSACAGTTNTVDQKIGNHRFELYEVNHLPLNQAERPFIKFVPSVNRGEFTVTGKMCNAFNGRAYLRNNIVSSGTLASTRTICSDAQLNALDHKIAQMLRQGAQLYYADGVLVLNTADTQLLFKQQDIR